MENGRKPAELAARVLEGEDPAAIPFQTLDVKKLTVNEAAAQRLELTIPPKLLVSAALRRQRRSSAEIRAHLVEAKEKPQEKQRNWKLCLT